MFTFFMHRFLFQVKLEADFELPPEFTETLVKHVADLLGTFEATGEGTTIWEDIQTALEKAKLAYFVNHKPETAGFHPGNRSKLGVGGSEAQVHGKQILDTGFSLKKAADATAFEMPPPPLNKPIVDCNKRSESPSQGLIPPSDSLRIVTIGGSHTNTFLRAVNADVRAVVPELADANGNLNAEHLSVGRPRFAAALKSGLIYFTMHWACPYVWEAIVDVGQKALNTEARGQQGEVEIMLSIHNMFMQDVEDQKAPDWKRYEAMAKKALPPCSSYMGAVAQYVKCNAGGVKGDLLKDLSRFIKAFACDEKGPLRVLGDTGPNTHLSFAHLHICVYISRIL